MTPLLAPTFTSHLHLRLLVTPIDTNSGYATADPGVGPFCLVDLYVILSILLSNLVCASASLLFACLVSVHAPCLGISLLVEVSQYLTKKKTILNGIAGNT